MKSPINRSIFQIELDDETSPWRDLLSEEDGSEELLLKIRPQLIVYTGNNGEGYYTQFFESDPSLLIFNNNISSVLCISGIWRLYKDREYNGQSFFVRPGKWNLPSNFDDTISSILLHRE